MAASNPVEELIAKDPFAKTLWNFHIDFGLPLGPILLEITALDMVTEVGATGLTNLTRDIFAIAIGSISNGGLIIS